MGPRPAHLKLAGQDSTSDSTPAQPFFQYADLPSPRVGEAPPALSPLDAIAMHSRILAKRFQDSERKGRRISRLQHADVANELANRPGFFRNVSGAGEGSMADVPEEPSPTSPQRGEVMMAKEDETSRPVSYYPLLGNVAKGSRPGTSLSMTHEEEEEDDDDDGGHALKETREPELGGARDEAGRQPRRQQKEPGDFGLAVPRASSPEPVDPTMISVQAASPVGMPSLTSSVDSVQSTQPRTLTNGSTRSQRSLRPPKSPAYPKSPRSMHSIRSVPPDSGDDDASVNGAYPVSSSRKFSGSSNMSRPQSPFSPLTHPMPRSPSMTSEYSMNGSQRRANCSRPMSGGSNRPALDQRPSFSSRSSFETGKSVDVIQRQPSAASGSVQLSSGTPSRQPSGDDVATPPFVTPLSEPSAGPAAEGEQEDFDAKVAGITSDPNSSYTYTKYALPRGRTVDRNSRGKRDSWIQKQFTWDDATPAEYELTIPEESGSRPVTASASPTSAPLPPFAPIERPMSAAPAPVARTISNERTEPAFEKAFAAPERPVSANSFRKIQKGPSTPRSESPFRKPWVSRPSSSASNRSSGAGSISSDNRTFQKSEALHKSSPSIRTHKTDSTDKTVKPSVPLHERSGSAELTPEEHLDVGIAAHSAGELNKSTYHLRLAAHAGLPTAMLLYALACRHGWGMRPNQADGVAWLRKAIDGAGLEVADIESTLSSARASSTPGQASLDPIAEAQERRTRKAQFALAVYELGISYMNGWGCPKDRPLAVQCYEVAGNWGDCDALAEAGFCYAQGTGVRKDLRKAAGLYRRAAEGGMSMAGNSWIYKPKYMDNSSPASIAATSARNAEKERKKAKRADNAAAAEANKESGSEPKQRSRARSIWSRKKGAA